MPRGGTAAETVPMGAPTLRRRGGRERLALRIFSSSRSDTITGRSTAASAATPRGPQTHWPACPQPPTRRPRSSCAPLTWATQGVRLRPRRCPAARPPGTPLAAGAGRRPPSSQSISGSPVRRRATRTTGVHRRCTRGCGREPRLWADSATDSVYSTCRTWMRGQTGTWRSPRPAIPTRSRRRGAQTACTTACQAQPTPGRTRCTTCYSTTRGTPRPHRELAP
mmetsp:Transcript_31671/g.100955  ORF Transcript_31671/g.100955 Transcript_31671/m.100955 type:complete len:223 (+) Transcript_31671:281-949(+)